MSPMDNVRSVSDDSKGPTIRIADPEEYGRLREIEVASETLFRDIDIGPFFDDGFDHLAASSVVFVTGDPPVGFASVGEVDGVAHLFQLSVDPSMGRQGLGTALLVAVCDWATSQQHEAVTLTTFRDVPWNGPFYARLGFRVVDDPSAGLSDIREHEKAIGDDDFGPRIAMRKDLLSAPT
jgi:GNAT superfamily N-acetyltransferase